MLLPSSFNAALDRKTLRRKKSQLFHSPFGVSLFSGKPKPLHRFAIVLSDTLPRCIRDPEAALRAVLSLSGGKPKPLHPFAKVLTGTLPPLHRRPRDCSAQLHFLVQRQAETTSPLR